MLDGVQPIYDALFSSIQTIAGSDFARFERGYWYQEDCQYDINQFPYAFLDQPDTTARVAVGSPQQYQYLVIVRFVVLTFADGGDRQALFFNEGTTNTSPGSVELLHRIIHQLGEQYTFGLPFQPPLPAGVQVRSWTTGAMERPTMRELNEFWENPNISGTWVPLIFRVTEDGPIPGI